MDKVRFNREKQIERRFVRTPTLTTMFPSWKSECPDSMDDHSFNCTNDLTQVQHVQAALSDVLLTHGVRLKVVSALNVALGEWLENIIQHAYFDQAGHAIHVQCTVSPIEIVLRVRDDGRPFDPCAHPQAITSPVQAHQTQVGRGIHLIRNLVDRLSYQRVGGQNILTLAKDYRQRDEF
jgi:anti-sigma regulatory factor (Ser/Thr protein kinase)